MREETRARLGLFGSNIVGLKELRDLDGLDMPGLFLCWPRQQQ